MHQPAVSRLEQKDVSSLVVGTLLAVIKAMGGKLIMQADTDRKNSASFDHEGSAT